MLTKNCCQPGQSCEIYKHCSICKQQKHRFKEFNRKSGSRGKSMGKAYNGENFRPTTYCKKCSNKLKYVRRKMKPLLISMFGHTCQYCGKEEENIHVDHKIPVKLGGSHDIKNLTLACHECNYKKGEKTDKEYIKYLRSMI